MNKPLAERLAYDAAPKGYKRHTIFINVKLLIKARIRAKQDGITFTKLIEEALRNRIDFHGKLDT
jgi:hypothetical protein